MEQDAQLQKLTEAIEKLLNKQVAPVLPVAPVAPVLPIIPNNYGDHELLQRLDEKVKLGFEAVQESIKELKDGTKTTVDDHEKRIRTLEESTVPVAEHKALLKANDNNAIYLKWLVGLVGLLTAILIYHISGYHI
jgi:DNA repair photolyase